MINVIFVEGNLTRDPEHGYTKNGSAFCKFSIAFNEKYNGKETACFFDCTAWKNVADNVSKYCQKGNRVLVEGVLKQDRWVDKQNGQNRSKVYIMARMVHFLKIGAPGERTAQGDPPGPPEPAAGEIPGPQDFNFDENSIDDDVPF